MKFLIRTVYGIRTAYGSSTLYEMSRAPEQPRSRPAGTRHAEEDVFDPIWARPEPSGRRAPRSRATSPTRRSPSPTPRGSRRCRCAASPRELGLGTMSLYHYVRGKDELLDLMSDAILGGQLVDDAELQKGWRAGLRAIAHATRANFERHPWIMRRDAPAAAARSRGPTRCATSISRSPPSPTPASTSRRQMEIVALVDDYVFGFVAARLASPRSRPSEEETEPGVDAGRLRLHVRRSSRPAPTPTCAARRRGQPRRGRQRRGPRARWRSTRGASSAGSSACSTASRSSSQRKRRRGR